MPNYWVEVHSSPPRQRRGEVKAVVESFGGKLREDQLYQPVERDDVAYVLIEGPASADDAARMLRALQPRKVLTLLPLEDAERIFGEASA